MKQDNTERYYYRTVRHILTLHAAKEIETGINIIVMPIKKDNKLLGNVPLTWLYDYVKKELAELKESDCAPALLRRKKEMEN